MRAVFLDFDTLGPEDIDISPLTVQVPELRFFPESRAGLVAERVGDAEIVIVNKVRLDSQIIGTANALKMICLAATGSDNVALGAASDRGITVCNIRDYCTPSVVQHVFALILALTNHLREYHDLLASRAWADSTQFCLLDFPIRELQGKTLGIVGLGSLGRGVAEVGRAFGMRIIAARRANTPTDDDFERVGLPELLERSHIVSLHCPLTADTENMIDTAALTQMRNDALLINTARGGLVDPDALVTALRSGEIAGAGIDVLRQEPPVDPNPLVDQQLPNLIVTPHIAWAARESRQRAVDEMAANIASFKNGTPRNRIA
jgi:glycerate dehydrogenase